MANLQSSITFSSDKIASFYKKRLISDRKNFHMSQTCKNDPGPPFRLNFCNKNLNKCPSQRFEGWLLTRGAGAYSREGLLFDNSTTGGRLLE